MPFTYFYCFLTFYRYSLSVDGQLLKEKGTAFKYSLKCHDFELNNANFFFLKRGIVRRLV